jgi:arylsulfatase A-like enzyme
MTSTNDSSVFRFQPVLSFLGKLWLLQVILKLTFFWVNQGPGYWENQYISGFIWAAGTDLILLILLNAPLFLLFPWLQRYAAVRRICLLFFYCLNAAVILLNSFDIFYFPFQRQRANADLLFVLDHVFDKTIRQHFIFSFCVIVLLIVMLRLLWNWHRIWAASVRHRSDAWVGLGLLLLVGTGCWLRPGILMPSFPLTRFSALQLPFVQNSAHSFVYSLFRFREGMVKPLQFMPESEVRARIQLMQQDRSAVASRKNIVLCIMESIPADFFDDSSGYRMRLPFLDSIRNEGVYFDRAYSYSHNSNKGITAILAGLPTITDIPVYHSPYVHLPLTGMGTRLKAAGYQSYFFIGDHHDDFGFAKCARWLGIGRYFSREDIPNESNLPEHAMGLHDGYVLPFVSGQLQASQQPFLAVWYNTSTHYPNELPPGYVEPYPKQNTSDLMKSASYYSQCLANWLHDPANAAWVNNSVFIFCSDHWMYPDARRPESDVVQSFRIPIFIYEPGRKINQRISLPVSQLDILNTVIHLSGSREPFISYGQNLLGQLDSNRMVIARESADLYEVINRDYVIGFNPTARRLEFAYAIQADPGRTRNLAGAQLPAIHQMEYYVKAFLQTATQHYTQPGYIGSPLN